MIRKGDKVTIKPEWRDPGDEEFAWVACDDEEKGRVTLRRCRAGTAKADRERGDAEDERLQPTSALPLYGSKPLVRAFEVVFLFLIFCLFHMFDDEEELLKVLKVLNARSQPPSESEVG